MFELPPVPEPRKRKGYNPKLPLGRLVPFPEDFSGYNHPFKTDVEQREERAIEIRKTQIMNYLCLNSDSDCISQDSMVSGSTDDPTKSIPTPPPSLSGGHVAEIPAVVKQEFSNVGSQGRKRKITDDSTLRQSKRKRVSVSGRYGIDPEFADSQILDDMKGVDMDVDKLKSVRHYLGSSDRMKKGEKYTVLGKRISSDGSVQYLIHWEGLVVKDK